jgi:hypothetical protein
MSTLVPCSGCNRHVKSDETNCPFCQAAVTPVTTGACTGRCARPAPGRLVGAALVAAGAALLGAACESSQSTSTFPPYGLPPHFDAGTPADSGNGQTDAARDALPDAKK